MFNVNVSTDKTKPAPPPTPTIQLVPPRIIILDHPGSGAPIDLQHIAAAIHRQVNEHFDVFWNLRATIAASITLGPSDWMVGLFKDPDQPGALGYHDMTPNGTPLAKVFPLLDAEDGGELSVTISHEILEMLADPYLSRATQGPDGKFWAMETCDAVENDVYEIDGIKVSNFVTPHYFEPPQSLEGIKLDYMGLIKTPLEVRPGGYMQWNSGKGWHQVVHRDVAPRAYRHRSRRIERRGLRNLLETLPANQGTTDINEGWPDMARTEPSTGLMDQPEPSKANLADLAEKAPTPDNFSEVGNNETAYEHDDEITKV